MTLHEKAWPAPKASAPDLKSLVDATAETVLVALIELCHSSRQTLEDALAEVSAETRSLLFPMVDRRADAAARLTAMLGRLTGRHRTRIERASAARRARTRRKMQWHRGDDGAVSGDLYEYESETVRKIEVLLEDAVLPIAIRELAETLRQVFVGDCAGLEQLAHMARAAAPLGDDARDPADVARVDLAVDLAIDVHDAHDLNTTLSRLEALHRAPDQATVKLS